jgi:PTH1 family peptidyl-tRNA hydrolase
LYCVVGLGNPGGEYSASRHNVGFMLAEQLAQKAGADIRRREYQALTARCEIGRAMVLLMKPQTYMNNSGLSVAAASQELGIPPERVIVAFDDMDLPVGRLRLRDRGGSGGHRGVSSISHELATTDFIRVRLGIGRPGPGTEVVDHVLGNFLEEETPSVEELLNRASLAVEHVIADGAKAAMNHFNSTSPLAS